MAGLFQAARSVSAALTGGRTPACWRHDLARSTTARLDALRRACDWVEALTEAPPKLRDEPLLGRCLVEMTEGVARPTEPKPEMARPERPRPTWPWHSLKRDHGMTSPGDGTATRPAEQRPPWDQITRKRAPRPPGEESLSPRPTLPPLELRPQTSRALLARLACVTPPDQAQDRPRGEPVKMPPAPKTRGVPPVARDRASRQNWLRDLARRAGRSLRQEVLGTEHAEAEQEGSPSLTGAWSVPVKGQPASSALLAHLVGVPTDVRDGPSRKTQSQTDTRRLPGTGPLDQPGALATERAPPTARVRHPAGGRSPEWPATPAAGETQPWPRDGQPVVSPEGISRTEGVGTEQESPARIAPPSLAPRLPSLLPARMTSQPSPPMATATIRQGASREETTPAEDDLSQLAAQIKRILDEEARRYGIDV